MDGPPQSLERSGVNGRRHSPGLAAFSGLVLPGAGQAYNGHPFRGVCVLLLSPLLLPWLLGSVLAWRGANKMVKQGGRFGRGGVFWIAIHAWLILNLILIALIALTMEGVLR